MCKAKTVAATVGGPIGAFVTGGSPKEVTGSVFNTMLGPGAMASAALGGPNAGEGIYEAGDQVGKMFKKPEVPTDVAGEALAKQIEENKQKKVDEERATNESAAQNASAKQRKAELLDKQKNGTTPLTSTSGLVTTPNVTRKSLLGS